MISIAKILLESNVTGAKFSSRTDRENVITTNVFNWKLRTQQHL